MSVLSHFKVFFVIIVGHTPSEKGFALTSETDWLSEHLKNRTDGNTTQLLRGEKKIQDCRKLPYRTHPLKYLSTFHCFVFAFFLF